MKLDAGGTSYAEQLALPGNCMNSRVLTYKIGNFDPIGILIRLDRTIVKYKIDTVRWLESKGERN